MQRTGRELAIRRLGRSEVGKLSVGGSLEFMAKAPRIGSFEKRFFALSAQDGSLLEFRLRTAQQRWSTGRKA